MQNTLKCSVTYFRAQRLSCKQQLHYLELAKNPRNVLNYLQVSFWAPGPAVHIYKINAPRLFLCKKKKKMHNWSRLAQCWQPSHHTCPAPGVAPPVTTCLTGSEKKCFRSPWSAPMGWCWPKSQQPCKDWPVPMWKHRLQGVHKVCV